jgi:hypothetical protein
VERRVEPAGLLSRGIFVSRRQRGLRQLISIVSFLRRPAALFRSWSLETSTDRPPDEHLLAIPTSIQHTDDRDSVSHDPEEDPVGRDNQFPVFSHTDLL